MRLAIRFLIVVADNNDDIGIKGNRRRGKSCETKDARIAFFLQQLGVATCTSLSHTERRERLESNLTFEC